MARPAHVAVVGGGFSGALTALHLLRESAPGALRVTLVSEQPQPGRGLAYRFDDDNLLLNVPAGNMSAWADEPGHFLAHLQRIDPSLSAGAFVSRRLFGEYLSATWVQAQAERPEDIHMVHGEATGLARAASGRGWQIALASGESLQADQVVLALGHQAVRCPVPVAPELAPRVLDPWD